MDAKQVVLVETETADGRLGLYPVEPTRRHYKQKHTHDAALYKERNRVECFFNRLKNFRRIATCYDKLATNFMGFVTLAAIMLCVKEPNGHQDLECNGVGKKG